MPGLLHSRPVSDAERRRNDRHRLPVVLAVLAVLGLYAWLFTDAAPRLGLPTPGALLAEAGVAPGGVFDAEGVVDSPFEISWTRRLGGDAERLLWLALLAGAFLAAYGLPLRAKQPALVLASTLGIALLFGAPALLALLACHVQVWLAFHPRSRRFAPIALAPGALAGLAGASGFGAAGATAVALLLALGSFAFHAGVLHPLRGSRRGARLRAAFAHVALLTVVSLALFEGLTALRFTLPLGVLLFFWQWARVILYHLDLEDGRAPADVPLDRYLAVFLSPAVIPVWQWGIAVGQGYAYVQDNFLCEDKNRIVLGGVRLLLLAALYLCLGQWLHGALAAAAANVGLEVHGGVTRALVADFMRSGDASAASVLATTFLDLVGWILTWGGVFHLKVGVWQLCGFRVDPVLQRPFTATNLVSFWPRITYHYREFLVRAFYYPVFFRCFRTRPKLRIVAATLAAAGVGNLIWGHLTERLYFDATSFGNLADELATWPYFLLLGGGIAATELFLRGRRGRRRPWTPGPRLALDVLAAWATFQFFTLIRIFRRPAEGSDVWDHWRLFLRAFGIEL